MEDHTRGFGIGRSQTRGCTLGARPAEEEACAMLTSVPSDKARELHRSQRALVAASLIACPPAGKIKRA